MATSSSRRSSSLPSLSQSPFAKPLSLVTADVQHRFVLTEAVGGRKVRVVHNRRMPFVAFERGIEWELPHVRAALPKDRLPPLGQLIQDIQAMNLEVPAPSERKSKKRHGVLPKTGGARFRPNGREDLEGFVRRGLPSSALERLSGEDAPEEWRRDRASNASSVTARGFVGSAPWDSRRPSVVEEDGERSPSGQASPGSPAQATGSVLFAENPPKEDAAEPQEAELPFPWSDEELRSVFDRFDRDHELEVRKEDLPAILKYLGARQAPEEAMRIANSLTSYATLNFEELVDFIGKFRDYDVQLLQQEFTVADLDGSGQLDFQELHALLHRLGYAPTSQSTLEAMQILDRDGSGTVDIAEFERLREHLRKTEGMTAEDARMLRELYDKTIARLPSGRRELVPDEAWRIIVYLGYSATLSEIRQIAAEIDQDSNGEFSFQELLKLVRRVRDAERDKLVHVFQTYGSDPTYCPTAELGRALCDLGYIVQEETIQEVVGEVSTGKGKPGLDMPEFVAFLRRYRQTEGFTRAEREDLEGVFQRESKGENGGLRTLDVGRVLRWSGFTRTVQQVQNLVAWIDFDCSGELEFDEFLKLVRRMYQDEARARHDTFRALENTAVHRIPTASLTAAIVMLHGVEPDPERVQESLNRVAAKAPKAPRGRLSKFAQLASGMAKAESPNSLSLQDFEAFFHHYRQLLLEEMHANAGYSPMEVEKLRSTFNSYDKDGGGTLQRGELLKMISEYFPDATKSKAGQRDIQMALAEVDADGNGELNFNEFLLLMRKCDDARDAADLKLELDVVKECSMASEEVEGFRQIFSEHIDWKGELSLDTLIILLGKVVEISAEATEELARMVREVHPQGRDVARFPQFLQLIRNLTRDNYRHVNDLAARAVRDKQKKAARS